MNQTRLVERIRKHEGYRAHPYRDSLNVWTIGTGTNIQHMPLPSNLMTFGELLNWLTQTPRHEAWLLNDIAASVRDAQKYLGGDVWDELTPIRQEVLVELAYQLGAERLKGFVKLRKAVLEHDYVQAKAEMLSSKAYQQTPARWAELATLMEHGDV